MISYLDCRSFEKYQLAHHQEAASIPANSLFQRMHELPPRKTAIHLIVDEDTRQTAISFLEKRNYSLLSITIWDDHYEAQLKQEEKLMLGNQSNHLWQPSPLVKYFIHNYPSASGKGLDIACGAGRDSIYLAQNGWEMSAIDHHADAIERCTQLAQINQVKVNTYQLDLEAQSNELAQTISPYSLDLICVARYLHRPLFETIKTRLRSGGFILYQTFMQGCERLGGPKNPKYLLKPNELNTLFSDFNILQDDIIEVEDGRMVSAFIARKA